MPVARQFQIYVYGPDRGPFLLGWDDLVPHFSALSGLYFEWDGSWTWAGGSQGWQLSGTIFDNGQKIQYVDLHGRATTAEAAELLRGRLWDLFAAFTHLETAAHSSSQSGGPGKNFPEAPNLTQRSLADYRNQLSLMRLPEQQWQDLQNFEADLIQV